MIQRYLKTSYQRGGRGPVAYDCFGIVRAVRHEVFGKSVLPSFGNICPQDKRNLTAACIDVRDAKGFHPVQQPVPGAIATAWRASLCVHVGICVEVDGRLWVLETDEPAGPALIALDRFEDRYTKVIYYDD